MPKPWFKFYDAGVPYRLNYPSCLLANFLDETVEKFPENLALIFQDKEITYRELGEKTRNLAAALEHMGIRPKERIAIMMPNCPQYIIAYYAILKIGGIVVNVNPMFVERELEFQLKDADVANIIAFRDYYPRLKAVREKVGLQRIILTDFQDASLPNLFSSTLLGPEKEVYELRELWTAGENLSLSHIAGQPEDIALLQYTGGTTGLSKGAILTHHNLVANVLQCVSWNPEIQKGKERMLAVLPFFHVYGMTVAMNEAIYLGATIILLPRFQVDETLEAINKYRPTRFPGVPTMYIALINHPQIKAYDISSIKVCSCGSAPMPVESLKKFEELTGGKISEGYGLTEASPVTHGNPFFGKRKIGSIGLPRPDTDAKIVDLETGERELPPGEEGELCIRGPQVMKGYWNRPEETAKALRQGWLYTGDIARMDDEGYFYIVDRKKDMIICSGYNVYPREIEEVLYMHPQIMEACVIGVPDPYRGETVKAFVVLKKGGKSSAEEIIEFCRQNLARYKAPTIIEFREELPKSHVGKILRKALRGEEEKK